MVSRRYTLLVSTGKVVNRAGQGLPRTRYDTVIVGGGLLGLACAFYTRRFLPERTLLVIEADGVPSEEGATFVSPAVAHGAFEGEARRRAAWALSVLARLAEETGVTRPHDVPFREVGWARSLSEPVAVTGLETLTVDAFLESQNQTDLTQLVNFDKASHVLYNPKGGYGSAEAAALHFGHGAVKEGADLLLNARATLAGPNTLKLERLEFARDMQRKVVRREVVEADTLVVAAGAWSAALVEDGLGEVVPVGRVYMQYPRVERDARLALEAGRVAMPVIEHQGFTLRPQGEGLLVVPPTLPPDPAGYVPTGGNLMGVRTGLRRELLDALMAYTDDLPLLEWDTLNLGKTVSKVRGAWEVLTESGRPEWRRVGETAYVLLGGREGFTLGLAAAYDLAATLAEVGARPWNEEAT